MYFWAWHGFYTLGGEKFGNMFGFFFMADFASFILPFRGPGFCLLFAGHIACVSQTNSKRKE